MKRGRFYNLLTLAAFLLFGLLFFSPQPTFAQSKTFEWTRFDVDITLMPNGDMRIVETQTLQFSGDPFRSGYATIYTGKTGSNDGIVDFQLREGDTVYRNSTSQSPGTYSTSQEGDSYYVDWFFAPTTGSHTYVFSYTVKGGVIVGTFEQGDGDQIYWIAIPDDHPGFVNASKVTVHLPEGVAPQQYEGTTNYLVAGYLGNTEDKAVQTAVFADGRTITFTYDQRLAPGTPLKVRVQFPHGLLDIPVPAWQSSQQKADVGNLIILVIALLIAVGGPLIVLLLWYLEGKDPALTVAIPEIITEPPDDLPPGMVGTLLDESADMQDIMATVVDLAKKGYIEMTELDSNNFVFKRIKIETNELRQYETDILQGFFATGQPERTLDSMRYKFASKIPAIQTKLYEELVREQLVPKSPEKVRAQYRGIGCGFMILTGLIFFILTTLLPELSTTFCVVIAAGLVSVSLLAVSSIMPVKTAKGAETAAKWKAFKKYLRTIESHRKLDEANDIFEKYLPYAIAFGIERSWINKFSSVPTTRIPGWYIPRPYNTYGRPISGTSVGDGMPTLGGSTPTLQGMSQGLTGGLSSMSSGLTRMLNSTSTIMKSTPPPPSSGGGRSSGGSSRGFSGGGGHRGGGGGGRGFR